MPRFARQSCGGVAVDIRGEWPYRYRTDRGNASCARAAPTGLRGIDALPRLYPSRKEKPEFVATVFQTPKFAAPRIAAAVPAPVCSASMPDLRDCADACPQSALTRLR